MTDLRQQWFKIWAAEALLSDDLDDLLDHEERIWWRLLMVASLENERWTFEISKKTARKCHTTELKLTKAVKNFLGRGMLSAITDDVFLVTNGVKWNEQTERRKRPSDSPEAVRERVNRLRARKRNEGCNDALQESGNDAHKEEEEDKEKEKEEDRVREPAGRQTDGNLPSAAPNGRRPKKAAFVPLSEEERQKLLTDFPGSEEQIELALAHEAHWKYPTGQYLYVRNWLKRPAIGGQPRPEPSRGIEFVNDMPKPRGITVPDMGFRDD